MTIISVLEQAVEEYGLQGQVRIVAAGCMGLCAQGPLMRVEIKGQKDVLYKRLEPLVARLVMAEHVVPALKLQEGEEFELPEFLASHVLSLDLPFFTKQEKVVLKLAGHMDPGRYSRIYCQRRLPGFGKGFENHDPGTGRARN